MKLRREPIVRFVVIGGIVELSFHKFNDLTQDTWLQNIFSRFFILVSKTFSTIHGKLRWLIFCIHLLKVYYGQTQGKKKPVYISNDFCISNIHNYVKSTYITWYYLKLLWYSETFLTQNSMEPTFVFVIDRCFVYTGLIKKDFLHCDFI